MSDDEIRNLAFDFQNLLASGVTLSTASDWVATVKSGTDATPSDIVSGSASISGTKSIQTIDATAGEEGVTYWLRAVVTTSDSQTLSLIGTLTIDSAEV